MPIETKGRPLSDRNRGRYLPPPAHRETIIGNWLDPRPGVVRAWDVKVNLSILIVVVIVIWMALSGGDPVVWGGTFLLCLTGIAGRSTIRHLRFTHR
ncbi:hypothetical protein [Streptomyces tanashiensis]|uniref:hypothetical protein n=1 Tax=Streptomyces tanashiensis TaxID=67367 RepID=UPI00167A0A77|nr:hypothetical protein [Streptomyces tanashiensis]